MCNPSLGRNQMAINVTGTMNNKRLMVYPCGVEPWLRGMGGAAIRTECDVMAAGITIMVSMATTISAQIVGLVSLWERGAGILDFQFVTVARPQKQNS